MDKNKLQELIESIHRLQDELEGELDRRREEFRYKVENKRVQFQSEIFNLHKKLKTGTVQFLLDSNPLFFLTIPIIYGAVIPMMIWDFTVTLYQWSCFPIYRIKRVSRAEYFVFDRAMLPYLNWIEKLNCLYCSYGNGLMAYSTEILSRTEQFWCPIKHARKILNPHSRYMNFLEYGDAEKYKTDLEKVRRGEGAGTE